MRLPTLDELKELLSEEYDCDWEDWSAVDPTSGRPVHGGVFRRNTGNAVVRSPYVNDEIDARVAPSIIKRICKDLEISAEEVFDWFDRQSMN